MFYGRKGFSKVEFLEKYMGMQIEGGGTDA